MRDIVVMDRSSACRCPRVTERAAEEGELLNHLRPGRCGCECEACRTHDSARKKGKRESVGEGWQPVW
jgi:hypothetical protein